MAKDVFLDRLGPPILLNGFCTSDFFSLVQNVGEAFEFVPQSEQTPNDMGGSGNCEIAAVSAISPALSSLNAQTRTHRTQSQVEAFTQKLMAVCDLIGGLPFSSTIIRQQAFLTPLSHKIWKYPCKDTREFYLVFTGFIINTW